MTERLNFVLPKVTGYTWRAARRDDAEALHRLLLDIEAVDQRGWVSTLDERRRDFDDPATSYETDTLLAINSEGEVTAMGWVFAPPEGEEYYSAYLWGEVHPAQRNRGLGELILTWMEARGRKILTTRPAGLPRYLRGSCQDQEIDRIALYEQHGFQPVRSAYRMRCDLTQPIPEGQLPDGLTLSQWTPELDQAVMEACNEAFRDHWGFIPISLEAWKLWFTGNPNFRPDLTFIALDGNEVAGLSLNQVREEENAETGIQEGWIQELAVRQPWRKRGIATALLCTSLQAFKQVGLAYAGLGVDTENLTGALRIYERLGFVAIKRSITFSKTVME